MDIKKALLMRRMSYLELNCSRNDENYLDLSASYLKKGVNIIQINPSISDNLFLKLAKNLRQLTSFYDALLIIKNRVDMLQLSNADGILLDSYSVGIKECKKILDKNILIGVDSGENIENCDFLLTDKTIKNFKIPTYRKIKSNSDITLYEMEKYDNNQ